MEAPYTMLASLYLSFNKLAFSKRNHLTGSQLASMPSPSHITLAHITQSWDVWCAQVMSLPAYFPVLCCMFSFILLPALSPFFHLRAAVIAFSFSFVAWLCRMKNMWGGHQMTNPDKWSIPKMSNSSLWSVHQLFKCSDHVNETNENSRCESRKASGCNTLKVTFLLIVHLARIHSFKTY